MGSCWSDRDDMGAKPVSRPRAHAIHSVHFDLNADVLPLAQAVAQSPIAAGEDDPLLWVMAFDGPEKALGTMGVFTSEMEEYNATSQCLSMHQVKDALINTGTSEHVKLMKAAINQYPSIVGDTDVAIAMIQRDPMHYSVFSDEVKQDRMVCFVLATRDPVKVKERLGFVIPPPYENDREFNHACAGMSPPCKAYMIPLFRDDPELGRQDEGTVQNI